MGKTYLFECDKCGYRAAVCGGATEGKDLRVQTIACKDCRALYDAVTALRLPAAFRGNRMSPAPWSRRRPRAPTFAAALNRLPKPAAEARDWEEYPLTCPVSPLHRVIKWHQPGRCPRCSAYMDASALPFRVWD